MFRRNFFAFLICTNIYSVICQAPATSPPTPPPNSPSAAALTSAPHGPPSGASTGLPHGPPSGASTGLPHGPPSGASTGLPHGPPSGASTGLPHGPPSGASTGLPHGPPSGGSTGLPHGPPSGGSTGLPHGPPSGASRGLPHATTTSKPAVCGDKIVDKGEECDCGAADVCESVDPCCTPVGGAGTDKECTFRKELGRVCSPRDACCAGNCSFAPNGTYCSGEGTCSNYSHCSGDSSKCPEVPQEKTEGMPCAGVSRTCNHGYCNSTVCRDKGMPDCWCSPRSFYECHICCLGTDYRCYPASHFGFYLPDGGEYIHTSNTKCNGGFCDWNGICHRNI